MEDYPAHSDTAVDSLNHAAAKVEKAHLHGVRHGFQKFAQATSAAVGSPWVFFIAALLVLAWAFSRPLFKDFDTWQLVINTATTIVTFLMVFLIQSTQNRDAKAMHLKLDELIRAKKGARNKLVDLENCTDEELDHIEKEFKRVRSGAERHPDHPDRPNHHAHPTTTSRE